MGQIPTTPKVRICRDSDQRSFGAAIYLGMNMKNDPRSPAQYLGLYLGHHKVYKIESPGKSLLSLGSGGGITIDSHINCMKTEQKFGFVKRNEHT